MLAAYMVFPSSEKRSPCATNRLREQGARPARVREVDRGHVEPGGAGRPEGLPVGCEAALVAEHAGEAGGEQLRLATVGAHVVDVRHPRRRGDGAQDADQQAARLVDQQRLVRAQHRQTDQVRGLARVRGVGHVQHHDAQAGAVEQVADRVQPQDPRGVEERAGVSLYVGVAQRLETAGRAVPTYLFSVAGVADQRPTRVEVRLRHPALERGRLRPRARPALRLGNRLGHHRVLRCRQGAADQHCRGRQRNGHPAP